MKILSDEFRAWLADRGAAARPLLGRGLAGLVKLLATPLLTVGLLLAVQHGCPGPGPLPPNPPGPVPPGPTPPNPPGPVAGLHALLVYESADLSKYPPAQANVLYAKSVRDYLDAHTPAGADGKTHAWRMWDVNVDPASDEPCWKALMARPHASLPWLVLADGAGKPAFEGPLPADVESTLTLLKKYGGN